MGRLQVSKAVVGSCQNVISDWRDQTSRCEDEIEDNDGGPFLDSVIIMERKQQPGDRRECRSEMRMKSLFQAMLRGLVMAAGHKGERQSYVDI